MQQRLATLIQTFIMFLDHCAYWDGSDTGSSLFFVLEVRPNTDKDFLHFLIGTVIQLCDNDVMHKIMQIHGESFS